MINLLKYIRDTWRRFNEVIYYAYTYIMHCLGEIIGTRMIQQRTSTAGQLGWAYGRSYLCSRADSWSDSWRITVIACLWSLTSSWSHNYPAWRPIPSVGPTVRARLYAYVYVFAGTSDAACTSARAYIHERGREREG